MRSGHRDPPVNQPLNHKLILPEGKLRNYRSFSQIGWRTRSHMDKSTYNTVLIYINTPGDGFKSHRSPKRRASRLGPTIALLRIVKSGKKTIPIAGLVRSLR